MRSTHLLVPLIALTSGCFAVDPIAGVWLIRLGASEDPVCTSEVTHNFVGGVVPTDEEWESPWTIDAVGTESDGLVFAQIVRHGDGELALVLEDRVLLGSGEGDDWTFSWTNAEETEESQAHDSGYTFAEDAENAYAQTVTLTLDGDEATGTMRVSAEAHASWSESDVWDPVEVGIYYGQMPAPVYLVDGSGDPIFNDAEVTDCAADPCELSDSTLCEEEAPFTATRTEYPPEAYEGVRDAGQPAGVL